MRMLTLAVLAVATPAWADGPAPRATDPRTVVPTPTCPDPDYILSPYTGTCHLNDRTPKPKPKPKKCAGECEPNSETDPEGYADWLAGQT